MNLIWFIVILFTLQGICLLVGSLYAKGVKSNDDYFLASRGLSFFPLMMTFVATQVGGGLVLGSAEEAFRYGWSTLFYPLGAAVGLIFLSLGIGRRLASFQVSTVAQLFEVVYSSSTLKKMASLLSIVSLFMIFIGQLIASKKFMVSIGVDSEWLFIGFWTLVIIYTSLGGLKAVVATDIIQAFYFIIAFAVCFFWANWTDGWSLAEAIAGPIVELEPSFDKLTGWLFMPLLFMIIEQDMAQRCFAAATGRTVTYATLVAGIITLAVCAIPVFLGVTARMAGLEIPQGASVLMTMIQSLSSPILSAFVGCAIIVAIISTADSLINAISSNISQDFFPKATSVRFAQVISAAISLLGIYFSYFFSNIVDTLIQSYELSVSCMLIPILAALFRPKGATLSAALAMGFGLVGFILFRQVPPPLPRELASLLLSALGFVAGELLSYSRKTLKAER